MKNLLVIVATLIGILTAKMAVAQTPLPRAGWIATASSSSSSDGPSKAIDGSASTRFSTGTNQTAGQWFSLDMIAPQTFSQVTIDPGSPTNDYTRAYQVFVSNDAVTWNAPVASGTGSSGILTIMFPSQTARFIGIVQTGSASNWWSIGEINVYGPGAAPTVLLSPTGWIASASATGGSDVPSRAIDGQTSTRWSTGTPQVNGQWFQLDMQQPQTLAKIVMSSDGSPSDYARGFQIFVSNSTNNFGSAVATGSATSSPITVTFPAATGRYLRIVQTGSASNWWSIAELSVYGVDAFSPVATVLPRTGWTATASSTCGADTPDKALDDNGSTRWSSGLSQASGQFFRIDMQAPRSFTKLTLDAGTSNGDYPRGYAVYVSQDGTNWGNSVATGNGAAQVLTINFAYQNARYIKIVQTGSTSSNWWSIHELNVYGVRPYLLMRQGWLANASLNASAAGNALDGNLSTRWTTNTSQATGQTFQVDMLARQAFNQVVLNADGASSDYPRSYQVFVSNDGSTWSSPVASGQGSSSMVLIAFPPQMARYIRVVQVGSASNWWSIAEFLVFGDCQAFSDGHGGVFSSCPSGATNLTLPFFSCNNLPSLSSCANAVLGQASTSVPGQGGSVRTDLATLGMVPGFGNALCNIAKAQVDTDPAEAIVTLAMVGELRNTESYQCLLDIMALPTPPRNNDEGPPPPVARIQMKAVQGLAFLKTAAGDAAVLTAATSSPYDVVRREAAIAYMWNHPGSPSARSTIQAALPSDEGIFADVPSKSVSDTKVGFNAKLNAFLSSHPPATTVDKVPRQSCAGQNTGQCVSKTHVPTPDTPTPSRICPDGQGMGPDGFCTPIVP